MKLIMESWRSFVKEAAISEAKRLAIFDFDGTIGFTGSKVTVTDKNTGETSRLSDEQFLEFLKTLPDLERKKIEQKPYESENYKASYEDYYTVPGETVENQPVIRKMLEFDKDGETSLFVLTARAPGPEEDYKGKPDDKKDPMSAIDDIQTYLHTFGIGSDKEGRELYVHALAGASKADFIDDLLRKNKSITELVVYEDSKSNLDSIDSMMEYRYSNLRSIIHPATGRDVRGRLVKYSLFLVDGDTITPQPTKADRVRSDKAERQVAHKAMSKYLANKFEMNLIPRGRQEGIINVFSGNTSVPDLLNSVKKVIDAKKAKDADDDGLDTTNWAKHYDTFSNILFDMIR